jgi:hypothetical protein
MAYCVVKFTLIFDPRLTEYRNASSDFEEKDVERLIPNTLLIFSAEAAVELMSVFGRCRFYLSAWRTTHLTGFAVFLSP